MASIGNDPNGHRRILFVAGDGTRKTIRLGKATTRQAEAFKVKIEALIGQSITGAVDDETSRWISGLDDAIHARIAAVGLVKPRNETTGAALGKFIDDFMARMTTAKPRTVVNMMQVKTWLLKFFPESRDMRTIGPADAEDFRTFMDKQGLGDNTARRHIGRVRQLFKAAIRRGIVRGMNPFEGISATVRADKARQFNVTRDMVDKVLEACPDAQWRLLVSLSR
jgi:hypothetical protein